MKLSLIFLAVLSAQISQAATSDQATKILNLINNKAEERFCGKGLSFLVETIRSHDGIFCNDEMNAALALGACEDVGSFDQSKCQKNAIEKLKKTYPYVEQEPLKTSVTIIAKNPQVACEALSKIVPDLRKECMAIAVSR